MLIKTAVRTLPSKMIKYHFTRGETLITKVMTGSIPKIKDFQNVDKNGGKDSAEKND